MPQRYTGGLKHLGSAGPPMVLAGPAQLWLAPQLCNCIRLSSNLDTATLTIPSLVMEHLSASEVHWWSQAPGLTWTSPGPGWTCPTLACSLALSLHPLELKLGHSYLHHAFSCKGACQCLRGTLVVSSTWAHLDHLPWSWLDLPNFGLLPSSVTASA